MREEIREYEREAKGHDRTTQMYWSKNLLKNKNKNKK